MMCSDDQKGSGEWCSGVVGMCSGDVQCITVTCRDLMCLYLSVLCCSASGLDNFMAAEEKEKFYTAIGYSGSSHNLALPKQVSTPAVVVFMRSPQDEMTRRNVRI